MRRIAIGDIHGCAKTFKKLVKQVELSTDDELILLGDLIDRGPNSKKVFDKVLQLREKGHTVVLLQGNHEEMLMSAKIDFFTSNRWLNAGGRACLASFGVEDPRKIDPVYLGMMAEMRDYYEVPGFIFVHAGLNFQLEFPFEAVRDMRWIRDWNDEINYEWLGDRIIVHGHSPRTKEQVIQMHKTLDFYQTLNLDTGCVYSKKGLGYLTAYDTKANKLFFEKNID